MGLLALFAPLGVVLGHLVGYAIALPDPHERAHVLAEAGHAWLDAAVPVAAGLAAVGSALAVARHGGWLPLRRHRDPWTAQRWAWLASRLAATQLTLFPLVEVAERLLEGHGVHHLLEHGVLAHGALAQVIVALALTALLWALAATAAALRPAACRSWRPHALVLPAAAPRSVTPRLRRPEPLGARAPPAARPR